MEKKVYDILGIGVGPFNLSLAALLKPLKDLSIKFVDNKKNFMWHPELMFDDATMQTSFLKDLVTPVDPTNPYSFLNYLVKNGQFYQFLNTARKALSRLEFEAYCRWVSVELKDIIDFDSNITNVSFHQDYFRVEKEDDYYLAKNLCVAAGPKQNIPDCAIKHLGTSVFHAKSKFMQNLRLDKKKVLIVGGGQTGVETFRNALKGKWGSAESVSLITGRQNLQPLDEGPFTNEVFTPNFVSRFHSLPQTNKDSFTKSLLLASDGNTPEYLQELYNELYLDKFYHKKFPHYAISPMRWLKGINKNNLGYQAIVENMLDGELEQKNFDVIILATGFKTELPKFMDGVKDRIEFDQSKRPILSKDYKLSGDFGDLKIFAMNYSRHGHGVADPQTSLMSWRSGIIANSLLNRDLYKFSNPQKSFLNFFDHEESKI